MAGSVNWLTGLAALGGVLATLIGVFVTGRLQSRKTDVDESAIVLGKWKELVETHERQLAKALAEIDAVRKRVLDLETENTTLKRRVSELESENAGLKRAIAQNSQSTAFQLGRITAEGSEAVTKRGK